MLTQNHRSKVHFSWDIPLDPRDVAEIRRTLKPLLEQVQAQLILFGSRARGKAHRASDIDLAVRAKQAIPSWLLAQMRERLEESRIPFRVDLIDYAKAPEELKRTIAREGIPWPM